MVAREPLPVCGLATTPLAAITFVLEEIVQDLEQSISGQSVRFRHRCLRGALSCRKKSSTGNLCCRST